MNVQPAANKAFSRRGFLGLTAAAASVPLLAACGGGSASQGGGGGAGGTVKFWDTATGQELFTFKGSSWYTDQVYSIAFSPDGKSLAAGSNGHPVTVWRAASDQRGLDAAGRAR